MADNNNPEGFGVKVDTVPNQVVAPPSSFVPPDIKSYSGDVSGASPVRVSTEAIDWFANQLNTIAPRDGSGFVKNATDAVRAVDIRPGAFAIAQVLKSKIDGEGGLKGDTLAFFQGLGDILIVLQDSLAAVSKSYQDTEDDTTITGDNLNEDMKKAFGIIDGWKKGGQASWQDDTTPHGDGSQAGSDPNTYPKEPEVDNTPLPPSGGPRASAG
jgi:hypothetical protein